MEIHTLELPKIPKNSDGTALWSWLKFIASEKREEMAALAREDRVMAEAYAKLVQLSADEEARWRQESREKWEWDQAALKRQYLREGEAKGLAKGKAEGRVDVARELLRMGMAAGSIAKATGLSEGEIQALQKDDDKPAVS